MPIGIQNFQTLFKTYYPDETLKWLVPEHLPLISMIEQVDGLSGDIIDAPFLYGAPQGYSIDFNVAAAAAASAPRAARATLRCSQAYSFVEFFDKDRALSDGEAAYADIITETMTGKIQDFLKNLDLDLHASGTGWRGTVVAGAGGINPFNGATLSAFQVCIATGMALETVFDQDMLIQAVTYTGFPMSGSIFPPADGRAPTTVSSAVQITSIDPVNRVLTLTDPTAFTAGVFIVMSGGSIGFSSSNTYGGIIGLDAWVPYGGVSSSDNFCGVNRSVYPTRLAGYSVDNSRLSIEDAIKRGSARLAQGGARSTSVCLMNPMDLDALNSKLMSSVRYSTVSTATYGFDSIVINGNAGRIDVVSDPHQPQGYARLIDPSTWVLYHRMAIPHIVDVDNREMEQGDNFDGRTARLRFYGQLRCKEPHKNMIIKLPQVSV